MRRSLHIVFALVVVLAVVGDSLGLPPLLDSSFPTKSSVVRVICPLMVSFALS